MKLIEKYLCLIIAMELLMSNELSSTLPKEQISFDELYKEFAGFVYNVALRIALNTSDAEELTQEVFITVIKKAHTFNGLSSIKTWFYRVTVNTALNYLNKKSRGSKKEVELDEAIAQGLPSYKDTPEDALDKSFANERVNNLLEKLPPEQKACIVLRELQGLSYEEIAQVLALNINTVRTRIKRARETLMKLSAKLEE